MFYVVKGKKMFLFGLVILCMSFVYLGYTGLSEINVNPVNVQFLSNKGNEIEKENKETSQTVEIKKLSEDKAPKVEIVLPKENLIPKNNDFFTEYRMERDRTRGQMLEYIKGIINDPNSSTKMRDNAQMEILNITKHMGQETKLENLIMAKGYKDAVVFIENNSVTVVVPGDNLTQADIAKISDLAVRTTGCKMEQVYIMPKK